MNHPLTWLQSAQWNQALFQWIHPARDTAPGIVHLAIVIAHGGIYPLALLLLYWLWKQHAWPVAAMLVLAWLLSIGVESLIATYAWQPRPFTVGFGPAWMQHAPDNSMPSSHVTLAVMLAGALVYLRHWISVIAAAVITLALAWSRVYVGIHWPVDMVAACIDGVLCFTVAACVVRQCMRLVHKYHVHRHTCTAAPRDHVSDTAVD